VAIAVAASYLEATIPSDMVFIGEVGLGGELRGTPHVRPRSIHSLATSHQPSLPRATMPSLVLRASLQHTGCGRDQS
jgi:predicted ATP-dependent serine protease